MFDIRGFIKENLVDGVRNGAFAKEYANILSVNYLSKGMIIIEDVEEISSGIEAVLAEQEALRQQDNIPVEYQEGQPEEDFTEINSIEYNPDNMGPEE